MTEKKLTQFVVFARFVRRYLHDYGGVRAIVGSPFFVASLVMSLISYDVTRQEGWRAIALQTIPNLLGFSLGTYALLFTLISKRIKSALKAVKNSKGVSYLDEMNATFLHFIFVQVVAFAWAYVGQSSLLTSMYEATTNRSSSEENFNVMIYFRFIGNVVGVTLFLYAVLLVISASLKVYRIARIIDPDD